MGDDVVWFWESSWVFGPGSSFFVWVRGMGGGTNGQSASGAAAGAEFFCGVLGDGVASALRWMFEGM